MPSPGVVLESGSLKLNVGTFLFCFRHPSNTQQSGIHTICLTTRPRAHEKRMDLGGFLTCSVLSARTRRARAVTFTSASCLLVPYDITPGSSGTSANQRPSASLSKIMLKDSLSGGCGTVAITSPSVLRRSGRSRGLFVAQSFNVKVNRLSEQKQV